ncbi:MAG: TonB dependent receptor [Bacteroidota bacterium]
MKRISLYLLSMLCFCYSSAQKITGVIKNADSVALSNSTVSLLQASDNKILKLGITNEQGLFSFDGINAGNYFIKISHVGYKPFSTAVFSITNNDEINIPEVFLKKVSTGIKEIIVKANKPMIQVTSDKMVVNIDGTINAAGSDALELIRKSPGVTVDKDDNIHMSGKSGVQVYIDGKPLPLNGEELGNYLKSLQASQIDILELITNPSAKYDAEGNGGIINIRLKKNKLNGTNGLITTGYGIGIYSKYNVGASFNYRNKKINFFGNYNFNHAMNGIDFTIKREQLDTLFDFVSTRKIHTSTQGFKTGVDLFLDSRHTLGFLVSGNFADINPETLSITPISYIPTSIVDRILVSDNIQDGFSNNVNFNANYKFLCANKNELNIDIDYGFFDVGRNLYQPNIYYNPDWTSELNRAVYQFPSRADIDIYSLKTDYDHALLKGKAEFGIKSSYVTSDNNFKRYNVYNNTTKLDAAKSNQFNYKEFINAAYVNYDRSWKNVQMQIGVRVEQTRSQGKSYPINPDGTVNYNVSSFSINEGLDKRYINVFPTMSLNFTKDPQMIWNIAAGRRVDRPNYHDLNPFEYKLDEYTFRKGNIGLVPQFSNNISVTNTYRSKLVSKLSYSNIKDLLGQLVDTVDRSKNFLTVKNIAEQKIINLFESFHCQHKWYSGFYNANAYYTTFKADFGGGNRIVNTKIFSLILSAQNSFKLSKTWTAELKASYNSPTLSGILQSKRSWGIDIGAQKNIFKGMGNIRLSATDIFWTNVDYGSLMFAGQTSTTYFRRESRQLKINFTYRFGNKQIKSAPNRTSGTEDEIHRSQNSN